MKPFDELTIADDFIFGIVMSDPVLCTRLLEFILKIRIDHIVYPERQKHMKNKYGSKGVRLDVYVRDENNTVYDIEIQVERERYLSKRVRYYHSEMDMNDLKQGDDYSELKRAFVIFICLYDPFGADRYVYTFDKLCREDSRIELGDESTTVILNASGHVGEISSDLRAFLSYVSGMAPQTEYTSALDSEVRRIKQNETRRHDYMTLQMRLNHEGKLGKYTGYISSLREMRNIDAIDIPTSAKILHLSENEVNDVYKAIDLYPSRNDRQIAKYVFYGIDFNEQDDD